MSIEGAVPAVNGIAAQVGQGQTQPGPNNLPSETDAERFQAAMNQPPGGPQEVQPAQEVQRVQDAQATQGTDNPGDRILDGLSRMSSGYDNTMRQVQETLNTLQPGDVMSSADLLKLQFAITQVSVQQDVTGKVVGKATQNLDSFLKNQ
jgi:type III secretion system YscI/HrpB-like protein